MLNEKYDWRDKERYEMNKVKIRATDMNKNNKKMIDETNEKKYVKTTRKI